MAKPDRQTWILFGLIVALVVFRLVMAFYMEATK